MTIINIIYNVIKFIIIFWSICNLITFIYSIYLLIQNMEKEDYWNKATEIEVIDETYKLLNNFYINDIEMLYNMNNIDIMNNMNSKENIIHIIKNLSKEEVRFFWSSINNVALRKRIEKLYMYEPR